MGLVSEIESTKTGLDKGRKHTIRLNRLLKTGIDMAITQEIIHITNAMITHTNTPSDMRLLSWI